MPSRERRWRLGSETVSALLLAELLRISSLTMSFEIRIVVARDQTWLRNDWDVHAYSCLSFGWVTGLGRCIKVCTVRDHLLHAIGGDLGYIDLCFLPLYLAGVTLTTSLAVCQISDPLMVPSTIIFEKISTPPPPPYILVPPLWLVFRGSGS